MTRSRDHLIELLPQSRLPRGGTPGVYGLVHPVEGSIAYVGISQNMERRYWVHVRRRRPWLSNAREQWIAQMAGLGLIPPMVALDVFLHAKNSELALERERGWIQALREGGEAWLNVSATKVGGKGSDERRVERELAKLRKENDELRAEICALRRAYHVEVERVAKVEVR